MEVGVCECCLQAASEEPLRLLSVEYMEGGARELYSEQLEECFNLALPTDSDRLICEACVRRLRDAYSFKRLIVHTQQLLSERRSSDAVSPNIKKEDPFTSDDDAPLMSSVRATETKHRRQRKERDKIKIKGSNVGGKRKFLKIRLNPDYTKKVKCEIPKAPAKLERVSNSREREVHNAIAFLKYSNVTPFKGKLLGGYRCYFCSSQYEPRALRDHTRQDHAELIRSGEIKYKDYFFMYLDVTDLKCELCQSAMPDLTALRTHLTAEHGKLMFPEYDDRHVPFRLDADVAMDCLLCDKKFASFRGLEFHMNKHYRNCICEVCGDGFIEPKRLRNHTLSHATGDFPCGHCEKTFTSNHKRYMHEVAVHNVLLRFKCPHCAEKFKKYTHRLDHMSAVHNVPRAEDRCKICNKLFALSSALNNHMRREHMLERNVFCTLCDYRCFERHELKKHMMKHTGQRSHRCTVCDKTYPRKTTLTQHMRIHNNDRRFVCAVCGQAFVQNCSLKSHVKSHHPELACYGTEGKSSGADLDVALE